MLCELPSTYKPAEYRIKQVTLPWERRQAYRLRRDVFCAEQRVFEHDDLDGIDAHAQLLVAVACVAGLPEQVVGTVRIHQHAPGVWHGSRLAVDAGFRKFGQLGATLIRLAVASAHAQGCHTFKAHVQSQNAPLFLRLHWHSLGEEMLLGRPHHLMQADLSCYPPCSTPHSGFVTHPGAPRPA